MIDNTYKLLLEENEDQRNIDKNLEEQKILFIMQ
jgi:hypothetical protein